MIEHISHCLIAFANNPLQSGLAAASIAASIAAVFAMRMNISMRKKTYLIYLHLAALFFPLIFFLLSMKCNGTCNMTLIELAAYSVPVAFAASFAFGFIGIPQMYLRFGGARKAPENGTISKFIKKHAANINIPAPAIFFADSQAPFAFSSSWPKSMIVLSVGLSDILEKKEVEAVLLHELHHTREKASAAKLSAQFMKFSPFSIFKKFSDELNSEELEADRFAANIQGTPRFLSSAKKKVMKHFSIAG